MQLAGVSLSFDLCDLLAHESFRNFRDHARRELTDDAVADLRLTREYLVYLRRTMGEAADEMTDFDEAYAKTDWSRFAHLPAFEAANRRNAYNTYIRIQGGDK